jgi:tagatose-6-phosphate ketose/aldose isomerase
MGLRSHRRASTSLLTNRDEWLVPDTRYLWISFSRSGDSPEGVAVLEDALEELPDVLHLVVTCNPAGRMAALAAAHVQAYALVLDDAVNDRSLAMTGSFTNMVLVGQLLSLLWNDEDFAPTLEAMATAAEFLLDAGADLASEIAHTQPQRACFIGAGVLAAVARESALKMLELTAGRTLTMSESSLGLRHGPMSALNCNTVLTCFVSNEQRRRSYDLDLLAEVRCRKTTQAIVAIGASANADHTLSCDAFARIPDVFRPPVDVLFGQMLGFFASIEAGLKPDTPSPQGVITRVVQPFAMHR